MSAKFCSCIGCLSILDIYLLFLSVHHLFETMNLLFFCAQLSAVGDFVAEDESVGEIETDKVSL